MKIHIGVPLLTLAIFFSFIELSSQYNSTALQPGSIELPDKLGLWFKVATKEKKKAIKDGKNRVQPGLLDGQIQVCVLEVTTNFQNWVRKLMILNTQYKVDTKKSYLWTDDDTARYGLKFDKILETQ
ncbi:uncharacterized protein LOC117172450 [Belonocnema kinseyi]|uniref:uncharacterized protein LOC117172450 n=1 Tax=Belonocnema kinseyi TaxID=2817044 RepID=UPI00143CEAFF|nr:uncharacterized protein LOC117172450 [Belonocnema kinseyi]XP_033216287.1 uncharacterized protein LOC117172450 [Belonocnema kinseyi]